MSAKPPGPLFQKDIDIFTFGLACVAIVAVVLLMLAGCGPIGFIKDRFECGIKCPKYSSCKVVSSGVFTSTSGCVCDNAAWSYPSKDKPCPAPSPSAEPR